MYVQTYIHNTPILFYTRILTELELAEGAAHLGEERVHGVHLLQEDVLVRALLCFLWGGGGGVGGEGCVCLVLVRCGAHPQHKIHTMKIKRGGGARHKTYNLPVEAAHDLLRVEAPLPEALQHVRTHLLGHLFFLWELVCGFVFDGSVGGGRAVVGGGGFWIGVRDDWNPIHEPGYNSAKASRGFKRQGGNTHWHHHTTPTCCGDSTTTPPGPSPPSSSVAVDDDKADAEAEEDEGGSSSRRAWKRASPCCVR